MRTVSAPTPAPLHRRPEPCSRVTPAVPAGDEGGGRGSPGCWAQGSVGGPECRADSVGTPFRSGDLNAKETRLRRVNGGIRGASGASVHLRGAGPVRRQQGGCGRPDREARAPGRARPPPSWPPTRPPGTRGLVGATHRSWDGNPLPLPGYEPLARIPGAPTNNSPSVQSPLPPPPFPD